MQKVDFKVGFTGVYNSYVSKRVINAFVFNAFLGTRYANCHSRHSIKSMKISLYVT